MKIRDKDEEGKKMNENDEEEIDDEEERGEENGLGGGEDEMENKMEGVEGIRRRTYWTSYNVIFRPLRR